MDIQDDFEVLQVHRNQPLCSSGIDLKNFKSAEVRQR